VDPKRDAIERMSINESMHIRSSKKNKFGGGFDDEDRMSLISITLAAEAEKIIKISDNPYYNIPTDTGKQILASPPVPNQFRKSQDLYEVKKKEAEKWMLDHGLPPMGR
jgi:hypothetical protein